MPKTSGTGHNAYFPTGDRRFYCRQYKELARGLPFRGSFDTDRLDDYLIFATLAAIRRASSLLSRLAEGLSLRLDGFRCLGVLSSLNRSRKSVERANSPPVRQALTVHFRGSACNAPSRGDKAKSSVSHIAGGFAV
jgi:hypothetical protein